MLAGNGCLPAANRPDGDSRPNVVHERLGVVYRRLVSTIRCHHVLPIHDSYHRRIFRDLVLLAGAQLGEDLGSPDIAALPLQFALLFARQNCSAADDWIGSSARRGSIVLAEYAQD